MSTTTVESNWVNFVAGMIYGIFISFFSIALTYSYKGVLTTKDRKAIQETYYLTTNGKTVDTVWGNKVDEK